MADVKQVSEDLNMQSVYDCSSASTAGPKEKSRFPKGVFLIILNEFCERFSYYGLKTVLIIYLTKFLLLNENTATGIYHAFSMFCYFTPVLGAILADAYIGQYKTIVSLSIVYFIGELILTLTALKPLGAPNIPGPIIGLLLIALGTGGIKPCVAAFGASQFSSDQTNYLDSFFSVFYFSINAGSLISTLITPILRSDVKCFNADCFPIAFGVPAALMFVALVVFLIGTPLYTRKQKPKENIFKQIFQCIYHALRTKIKKPKGVTDRKDNWLDYSIDRFGSQFVKDVRTMLKIVCVFIPVPIFWALFDQQGSRWTLQALKLNTYLTSDKTYSLKADQIQVVNPVLILTLIPLFNWVVYPLLTKFSLLKKPLSRMTVGMFFCCLAFVCSALLELQIQNSYKSRNINNDVEFINAHPCKIQFISNGTSSSPLEFNQRRRSPYSSNQNITIDCLDSQQSLQLQIEANQNDYKNYYVFYRNSANNLDVIHVKSSLLSQPIGICQSRFFSITGEGKSINLKTGQITYNFVLENATSTIELDTGYSDIAFDIYDLKVEEKPSNSVAIGSYKFLNGARYTFIHYENWVTNKSDVLQLVDLREYEISIFYQLIQILVLTIGEILFSVSAYAFCYLQAPDSMKTILQAVELITIAFGNLIVLIVAEAQISSNQCYEYIFFAGLMAVTSVIFGFIAYFYKYVEDDDTDKISKNI